MTQIFCFDKLDRLRPHAETWDRLAAGLPFRSWAWMSTWWEHYGNADHASYNRQLLVVGVTDAAKRLVGLAPWYLDRSTARGRVIRFLGTGEVCSDYLGLLCEPGCEQLVSEAIGDWLLSNSPQRADSAASGQPEQQQSTAPAWDLLELEGYAASDPTIGFLLARLTEAGCAPHRREAQSTWRLELPRTWDAYLAGISKNQRKRLRREASRSLDSGRVVLRTVTRADELEEAFDWLIALHQRRRHELGEPGCFASPRFTSFHRAVTRRLLEQGQLGLHLLQLGNAVIAAEYQLIGGGVVYAYQAGWDVEYAELGPGNLATLATLRRAIEQGYAAMDFLRGDESYKRSWRAVPRAAGRTLVVPPRIGPRLRHGMLEASRTLKHWVLPPSAHTPPKNPVQRLTNRR